LQVWKLGKIGNAPIFHLFSLLFTCSWVMKGFCASVLKHWHKSQSIIVLKL